MPIQFVYFDSLLVAAVVLESQNRGLTHQHQFQWQRVENVVDVRRFPLLLVVSTPHIRPGGHSRHSFSAALASYLLPSFRQSVSRLYFWLMDS